MSEGGNQMKRLYRRILFPLISCFLLLLLATVPAKAADIVDSGYCGGEGDGTNLTWTLDSEGTLIISGTGKMKDYGYSQWRKLAIKTVRIENGVTSIGNDAFLACSSLINATISESVLSIGAYAFRECSSLLNVDISHGVTSIGQGAFEYCSSLTSIYIPSSVMNMTKVLAGPGCEPRTGNGQRQRCVPRFRGPDSGGTDL